jgi:hypothetical protein
MIPNKRYIFNATFIMKTDFQKNFLHFRFSNLCALLLIGHNRNLVGFQRLLAHGLDELVHEGVHRKDVRRGPTRVIVMIFARSLPNIKQNIGCRIGVCW